MSNVFISYAKEDAASARILSDALQRAGLSVWWDRHIPPGKTWDEVIGGSLDSADSVLVLWSKISVASRWVREEAERGASRNCLVPVFIEPVDPPFGFGRIEGANLSAWHGDDADPEFINLRDAIQALVTAAAVGKPNGPAKQPFVEPPAPRSPTPPSPSPSPVPLQPDPKLSSKFLWIAAAVVAVLGGGIYLVKHGSSTSTDVTTTDETKGLPNVVGMNYTQARQILQARGFTKITTRRLNSPTTPGTVLEQEPPPGTAPTSTTQVRLIIAVQQGASQSGLSTPQQQSPTSGSVFSIYPRVTTLVWRPVPEAVRYSVETAFLESNQSCADSSIPQNVRHIVNLEQTTYTFSFVGAQPGCWRVWAIDSQGRESSRSPWWEFIYTR